jgi:hypothetical protein
MERLHIYPLDDIIEHTTYSENCICNPNVMITNESMLIIHYAMDCRHDIEKAQSDK